MAPIDPSDSASRPGNAPDPANPNSREVLADEYFPFVPRSGTLAATKRRRRDITQGARFVVRASLVLVALGFGGSILGAVLMTISYRTEAMGAIFRHVGLLMALVGFVVLLVGKRWQASSPRLEHANVVDEPPPRRFL